MITAVKQYANAVYMYLYLQWYRYKIRTDFRYMVKEALAHKQDMREK